MAPTYLFRSPRARRALDVARPATLAALAALVSQAMVAGCGARVVVDLDGGLDGTGSAGGTTNTTTGTGVMTGAGSGTTGGGACTFTSTGTGNGAKQVTECFAPPPGGCPDQYHANLYIVPSAACVYLQSVDCGPIKGLAKCCYQVTEVPQPPPCGGGG